MPIVEATVVEYATKIQRVIVTMADGTTLEGFCVKLSSGWQCCATQPSGSSGWSGCTPFALADVVSIEPAG